MQVAFKSRLLWGLIALACAGCAANQTTPDPSEAGVQHGSTVAAPPAGAQEIPPFDQQSANGDFGFNSHVFQANTVADCSLAVGPQHVVATINRRIRFHTKGGAVTFDQDLNTFFSEFKPVGQNAVDTAAVFDPYSRRFFLSTMFFPMGSQIVLAVSDDDDPNGSWFRFSLDASDLGDYIDYPTLGFDEKAIYVSFKFTGLSGQGRRGAWTVAFDKQDLLESRAPANRAIQLWDNNVPLSATRVLDPAPAYFQILTGISAIFMRSIQDPLGEDPSALGVRVEIPKAWSFINNIPINGGSGQLLSEASHFYRRTVYRKDSVWAVHTVAPVDGPLKHLLRWYRIRMNGFPLSGVLPEVAEWGEIDAGSDAAGQISTVYPDFSVDERGNMFFVLQLARGDGRVDVARAYRLHGDPPSQLRGLEVQRAGTGAVSLPGWQDYSGVQLDPDQPGVFWGHTGYTLPGTWRTWVGRTEIELSVPVLEERLLFAQFAGGGGLTSELLLFNGDEVASAQVKVRIRNSQGQPPRAGLLEGFEDASEIDLTLGPNEQRILRAPPEGELETGSVEVFADLPLSGTVLFSGPFGLAGVPAGPTGQSFTVPIEIDSAAGVNTGLAVMNLEAAERTLELTLLSDQGQVLAQGQRPLAAQGQSAFFANEVDWTPDVDLTDLRGQLRVSSPGPISATAVQTRPGEFATFPAAADGLPAAAAGGLSTRGQIPSQLFFPQFAEGEGALTSQILLVNPDQESPAQATLDLRLRDGSPMSVDLNGQQVEGGLTVAVPAGGVVVLGPDGEGSLTSGSVSVTSDRPLAGTVVFSGVVGAAGVAGGGALPDLYYLPIESDSQAETRTGLAVMNLEEAENEVRVALIAQDGRLVAGDTRMLPPRGSLALFADEFDWSTEVDLTSFRGSMRVIAALPTAATAIQSRPGQFATLPVGASDVRGGPAIVQSVADLPASTGGVAVGPHGDIFVADIGLAPARQGTTVYRVTPQGDSSIFAQSPLLLGASGNTFDSAGNLFQSSLSSNRILRINPQGEISIFASQGVAAPVGLTADAQDTIYVANCGANNVLRISPQGVSEFFAGGPLFSCPNGIALDLEGNVYVANFNDGRVIKITPQGQPSLFATIPGGNNGHLVFAQGRFLVVGRLANRIYALSLDGQIEVLAGTGQRGHADGPASLATFSLPNGISLSPTGRILYLNETSPTEGNANRPSVLRRIILNGN